MGQTEESPRQVSWWAKGSRPIWFVVAFWMVAILASRPIVGWLAPEDPFDPVGLLLISFPGVLLGQVCFVAVVIGLRWRSWVASYAIGIVVAFAGLLNLVFSFWLIGEHDNEAFIGLALIPPLLLSVAVPLIAFRFLLGWRLVACDEPASRRELFRLEDLFTVTTFVAANIALLRVPQTIMEEQASEYWIEVLFLCGMAFAIGLLVLPICVWLALGATRRLVSVAGLTLLATFVPACVFAITQLTTPPEIGWSERWDVLKVLLVVSGGATVSFYASLLVLSRCGMSLVRSPKATLGSGDASDPTYRITRWLTAGAIVVAVLVSVGLVRLEQHRKHLDAENERLGELAKRLDGEIGLSERRVTEIKLGRHATDSDLDQYRHCSDIMSLDLSHSSVTDVGLDTLKHFSKIVGLTLNDTLITDEGLVALNNLPDLEWIELNGTQVEGSGFAKVERPDSLAILESNDTPFDDAGCRELRRFSNLAHVSLAGTRVTDDGLQHLSELKKLSVLDVGKTGVTGRGLSHLTQVSVLHLTGPKIDDTSISYVTNLRSLLTLDLGHTAITDASVEQLRVLPTLNYLDLTDTEVTGDGFRLWGDQNQLRALSLSRSAFDDAGVKHLTLLPNLTYLDLSATQITDACLSDLGKFSLVWLNIGDTRFTAAALLNTEFVANFELLVAPDQFTAADLQLLEASSAWNLSVVDASEESGDD